MSQEVDIDVPPARAKPKRFRRMHAFFYFLLTVLVSLGLWKAYELVLQLLVAYQEHKTTVHIVVALSVVGLLILLITWMLYVFRAHKRDRQLSRHRTTADSMPTHASTAVEEQHDSVVPK